LKQQGLRRTHNKRLQRIADAPAEAHRSLKG
jgi:hypothetical protein